MLSLAFSGCTENIRAKQFGGSQTINLPASQKLLNVTWKDGDLWVLFRPMKDGRLLRNTFSGKRAALA